MSNRITILGAGNWGTALGYLLYLNGSTVTFWDSNHEVLDYIKNYNSPRNINFNFTSKIFNLEYSLESALDNSDLVVTCLPAQKYGLFWNDLKPFISHETTIINCSKGIDVDSSKILSQLLEETMPSFEKSQYVVLSGPSYATEVFNRVPTAVVAASVDITVAEKVQKLFCNDWFRVYTNSDVIGVELAGALKNVIAIASGIAEGIGFGVNTQAALITRGNAEIIRLGLKLNANIKTFYGLAGIGDLMLTAMSSQSRNFTFGKYIGEGNTVAEAKSKINTVIEGLETVKSARKLASFNNVEMPIVEKVYEVLFENLAPDKAVKDLMTRDLKKEF